MYKQLILASTLGLGLAASPGVMAESDWRRSDSGMSHDSRGERSMGEYRHGVRVEREHRDDRRDYRRQEQRGHDDGRHHDRRRDARDERWHRDRGHHGHPGHHYRGGDRHRARHHEGSYGHQRWHRGDRIPDGYRGHRHVVHDYHSYRLYSPPQGHHWVRMDQDFVLAAVATGVIAAVVYGALN